MNAPPASLKAVKPLQPSMPGTLNLANLRRRALPMAAAAAALGLGGCGALGPPASPVADAQDPAAAVAAQRTREQVRAFTAGLDEAIAKIDRDKLRSEIENGQTPVIADSKTSHDAAPPTGAVTPSVLPAAGSQDSLPRASAATFLPATASTLPADLQLNLQNSTPMLTLASAPPGASGQFSLSTPLAVPWIDPVPAPAAAAPRSAVAVNPPSEPAPAEAADPADDPALDALHARVAAHPTLNTALALALLQNSEAKPNDPAIAKALSANDQKLMEDLLTALNGVSAAPATAPLAEQAGPLIAAAKKWQADADLVLPRLVLASRVDSYGVYTKIDPKFPAGKKQTVIIYCEVANFTPRRTADDWYETRLSQQETLATDDGLLLWRPNAEDVEDRSRNQRHDFYLVKKLVIPDNLAIGKYALRMSVTDRNSGKIAVVSLPIEITK